MSKGVPDDPLDGGAYCVDGHPASRSEYMAAERDAGFHGKPGQLATYSWSGIGSDGERHCGHVASLEHRPLCGELRAAYEYAEISGRRVGP